MDVYAVLRLRRLHLASAECPFATWFRSLPPKDQYMIDSRLHRVRRGLFGEINTVGDGVWELKFRAGPGFRIYFARAGAQILLLLAGGSKRTQRRDIRRAKELFAEYEKGTLTYVDF